MCGIVISPLAIDDEGVGIAVDEVPREGKANEALLDILSDLLDLKKRQVSLERGHKSRSKVFLIEGISPEELHSKLHSKLVDQE